MNNGVRLPNHYTHAKIEKVLSLISKDIHDFINIIYYAGVNDTQYVYIEDLHISKRNKMSRNLKRYLLYAHLEMLFCCV